MLEQILIACALGLLLTAAWNDLSDRRIPNWISAALVGIALLRLVLAGDPWIAVQTLGLAAGLFALLALVFAAGKLGGGDVKLLTAASLLAGTDGIVLLLTVTTLTGGALALVALMPALTNLLALLTRHRLSQPGLPYGVPIAAGGATALLAQISLPVA